MGYFKVDTSDFDEIWSAGRNSILFPLFAFLVRNAWRQGGPKYTREGHYRIALGPNQLILRTRQIARTLDIPESTLRDRLHRLEELEAIRIDEPVPRIKVVTTLLAYDYHHNGERIPYTYCAPSVVDLQADRDQTEHVSPQESKMKLPCNDLQRPYTDILRDSRLEDSENQSKLVRRESSKETDEMDECCEIDDEDFPSDARIDILINEICGRNPELQPEQVKEWAKSSQPIESILGHQK